MPSVRLPRMESTHLVINTDLQKRMLRTQQADQLSLHTVHKHMHARLLLTKAILNSKREIRSTIEEAQSLVVVFA